MTTAKAAAAEIVSQMNAEDRRSFTREGWREGVESMIVDEWSALSADDVLSAIEDRLGS